MVFRFAYLVKNARILKIIIICCKNSITFIDKKDQVKFVFEKLYLVAALEVPWNVIAPSLFCTSDHVYSFQGLIYIHCLPKKPY